MAYTYTQIHLQVIFAVKFRHAMINSEWEKRLFEYIIAIMQNHKHKVLAINGMPDHIHILIGFRPDQSLSELVQKTKSSTSKWINEEKLTKEKFAWQEGFGAFSYTKSHLKAVINYIENQKIHHSSINFKEEYLKILKDLEIDFDEKYLFKEPQDY
jgi:REP element-mobilizing transposase RayT